MPRVKQPFPTGYVTLKITLEKTDISRTIVIPASTRLEDLHYAMAKLLGWDGYALWTFDTGSDAYGDRAEWANGLYVDSVGKMRSAHLARVGNVLAKHGDSMLYYYDPKKWFKHKIRRIKDSSVQGTCCLATTGHKVCEEVEDVKELVAFLAWILEYNAHPAGGIPDRFDEIMDYADLKTKTKREEFCKSPDTVEMTQELQMDMGNYRIGNKLV